jgi:hypothetical protein
MIIEVGAKDKNNIIKKIASLPSWESLIAQSPESLVGDKTVSKSRLHPWKTCIRHFAQNHLDFKIWKYKAMEASCSVIAAQRFLNEAKEFQVKAYFALGTACNWSKIIKYNF